MKPRRIIVMMGTNNADGTMSASDFASNYRTALEAIKTAYPYTDIIVSAVPPIPEDHSSYPNMSMETINEFNDALAQMCVDNGYKFLNVNDVLVGDDGYGKSQYFLSGDIHLKKDALTAIMEYARTHAYLGTEDRRPDTDNIPERRKTGSTGTVTSTPTPSPDEKTYTAQYNVDKNVGGTLTSGDKKGVTSLSFKDLTSKSSVSVTAVPADGYEFLKWSDGNTSATRTDKDFKQNVNVTAMFGAKLVVSIKEGSSGTTTVGQSVTLHASVSDRSSINVDNDIYWTVNGTEFRRGISAGYTPDKEGTYEIKANVTLNGKTYSATYTLTAKAAAATPAPSPSPTPHEHKYVEESRVEATCTEAGKIIYKCSCGERKEEAIAALGHSWGEWSTVTEAGPGTEGLKKRVCSRCKLEQTEVIPALPVSSTTPPASSTVQTQNTTGKSGDE